MECVKNRIMSLGIMLVINYGTESVWRRDGRRDTVKISSSWRQIVSSPSIRTRIGSSSSAVKVILHFPSTSLSHLHNKQPPAQVCCTSTTFFIALYCAWACCLACLRRTVVKWLALSSSPSSHRSDNLTPLGITMTWHAASHFYIIVRDPRVDSI